MGSEARFPTNWGYICIEKWSQIFVSGIGSAHSESEEKTLFKLCSIVFTLLLIFFYKIPQTIAGIKGIETGKE